MKFTITFDSAEEVNLTLVALANLPYKQVESLIAKITAQAREQEPQRNQAMDQLANACGVNADLQNALAAAQARVKELEQKPPEAEALR